MQSERARKKWPQSLTMWLICLMLFNSAYPAGAAGGANENGADLAGVSGFTVEATAEKNAVTTGEQADMTVRVAAEVDREAAVSLQVKGPAGNVVARQFYPKVVFSAGSEQRYIFAWNVPDAVPTGNYSVGILVTDAERKVTYAEEPQALVLEVLPPIDAPKPSKRATYKAEAFTGRHIVKAGAQMTGTALVASSVDTTVQVKVELFNAHGTKLYSQTYDNQVMQEKKRYLFPIEWKVPEDAKLGMYKAIVSVSEPGGGELYKRNSLSGFFAVTNKDNAQAGDTNPPAVPAGLIAEETGDGFVKLRWNPVKTPDTAGYKVYVNGAEAGWSREVQAGQRAAYTAAGLTNGTAYQFAVTAVDLAGNESVISKAVSATPIDRIAPAAPQGLAAASGDRSVALSWTANSEKDLAGYKLYSSADGGQVWDAGVHVGTETSYTVDKLENGKAYTFALAAFDTSDNLSPKSVSATTIPVDKTAPDAPDEAAAEALDGAVLVRWSAAGAEDLEGYTLYVSEDGGATWKPGTALGNVLEYTVTGLTNDSEYTFAVTATDKAGNESEKSVNAKATPIDMAAPAVPSGLTAEAGDKQVTLRWTDAPTEDGVSGYNIYVTEDGGSSWLAPVNAGDVTEYVISGLTNDTAYMFAVTAFDARGNESAKSASVTAAPKGSNTDSTPPAVPVIRMGIPESNGAVLVWTGGSDADLAKYKIYKSIDGGTTWDTGMELNPVTLFFYQGLKGGIPYTFAISAIDTSGNESDKSATVTVTPIAGPDRTPPAVPADVAAAAGSKAVSVTWNPVPDEDLQNYYVYVTNTSTGSFNRIYAGANPFYKVMNLTNGVEYSIQVSAVDLMNNESAKSAAVKATPSSDDTTAPAVPSGLKMTDVRDGMLSLRWNEAADEDKDHYNVYVSTDNGATWRPAQTARTAAFLASGLTNGTLYTFAVTTVDVNDNESAKSGFVSGMPSKYAVPQGLSASAGDREVKLGWSAVTASDLKEYKIYTSLDGGGTWNTGVSAGKATQYTVKPLTNGQLYTFAVTAVRTDGAESVKSEAVSAKPDSLIIPPDPSTVAPELPDTNNVTFKQSVSFLYTGSNPVQFGVMPGVLQDHQVSVLTGTVNDTEGNPIPGVKITVLKNGDLGMTATREDGAYDIVVNGGSGITLQYEKAGYMTVQRKAPADWNEFYTMPEVVLKPYDTQVTKVSMGDASAVQVAQSSPVTDEDGTRQATMLFHPFTTATIILPDGTTQTLDALHVRATEYTVGDKGEEAMPGEIPHNVVYTYAVELSADEAVAAGAARVDFNKPVYVYVDNFLDLEVGSIVPNGYYNLQEGAWEAETDGLVVKLLSVTGGTAQIDLNGDGTAETDSELAEFGWTTEERNKLAAMYEAGKTLWRVPVKHFSPHDFNMNPFVQPDERLMPPSEGVKNPGKDADGKKDPCDDKGSIIGCLGQTLGQSIPVTGTSLTLDYNSQFAEGYTARSEIEIPVTDGRTLSDRLTSATVTLIVGGETITKQYSLSSLIKNLKFKFTWDGLDRYGRKLIGQHPYKAIVTYHYPQTMYIGTLGGSNGGGTGSGSGGAGSSFGRPVSRAHVTGYFLESRDGASLNREFQGYMTSPHNPYQDSGIAGWKLSAQDLLLNLEQGTVTEEINERDENIAFDHFPSTIFGPDGSYYTRKGNDIVRIKPFNQGVETAASLRSPNDELIAMAADGTMFAKDSVTQNLYRKAAGDSAWTHFAGNGTARPVGTKQYYNDGTPALSVSWSVEFRDYEAGPDGKLYFIDRGVLYRVDTNGQMFPYAVEDETVRSDNYMGKGTTEGAGTKENIGEVLSVEIGKDGTIYVLQGHSIRSCKIGCEAGGLYVTQIKSIDPNGEIRIEVGVPFASKWEDEIQGQSYNIQDGVKANEVLFQTFSFERDEEGNFYFAHDASSNIFKAIYKVDTTGTVRLFDTRAVATVKNMTAKEISKAPEFVDVKLLQAGPDDQVLLYASRSNDESMVFRTSKGVGNREGTLALPDPSGMYAGVYDLNDGRLVKRVSALTGKTHFTYEYDAEGRLIALKDFKGETVQIVRDGNGVPVEIISPYGQVTKLTVEDGRLTEVTNPEGETHRMVYDEKGLMKQFIDPENHAKEYDYSGDGRLIRAETASGGVKTLQRTEHDYGYEVLVMNPDGLATTFTVRELIGFRSVTMKDSAGAETSVNTAASMTTKRYPDDAVDFMTFARDMQWGEEYVTHVRTLTHDRQEVLQDIKREVVLADDYDPFSIVSMKTTTSLDGAARTREYFPDERKVVMNTAEGHQVVYYMDEWDRTVRVEEPGTSIAPIVYTYDERGRVKRIEQGPQFQEYTYNEQGLVETVANAAGFVKTYLYDAAGRMESMITPGQKQYQFGYDSNGNNISLVMPNGETINQGYNEDGEFASLRFGNEENGLTVNRTAGSSKDFSTLWSGRTIDYTAEGANMAAVSDEDLLREFTYDPSETLGRIKTINTVATNTYADQQTLAYRYDGMHVVAADFFGDAQGSFTYSNNKLGLMTGMESKITSSVYGDYSYDTQVSYNDDYEITQMGPFHYEYNGPNKRQSDIQDGNLQISRSYDDLGRVSGLTYRIGDKELYNVSYTYDLRNFLETKTVVSGGQTERFVYTYDADSQLTDVAREVNGSSAIHEHYEYDDNKNLLAREVTGSEREVSMYGAYDLLQQVGSTPYEFDADGNLIRRGSDTFHYGPGGELLEATANGDSIHYTYDGLGRLAAREDSQGKTQYLYGNMNQQRSVSAAIGPDGVITVYNYDLNGYLISLERDGRKYYVITDQVATPMQVIDESGETVKSIKYDSFGKLLEDSNPAFRLDIGFSGGIADEDTKLVRFSTRDYDALSGRWTARDQIFYESGQANMYAYVNNNPIIVRDPCGQGCIGGSFYEGIGGGAKLCLDLEGIAVCGEVGAGLGGGLDVSPFEELPTTHTAVEIGLKVKAGALAIAGGYEWKKDQGSPCYIGAPKLSLGLGPYEYDALTFTESKASGMPGDLNKKVNDIMSEMFNEHTDKGWNVKNGLEGAIKLKGCKSRKW